MAYAAVASLVQMLKHILDADNQHLHDKKKQLIESLHEKACLLLNFLEDSWQIHDEAVRVLEQWIRDVAYTGEDLMESFVSNPQEGFIWQMKSMLLDLASDFWPQFMEAELQDLQQVIQQIDSIMIEVAKFKDGIVADSLPRSSLSAGSSTPGAANDKSIMVGFDEDLMELKSRLTEQQSKLLTIPIVGMGGSGKTTLAISIYDDPLIVEHFHLRAWVTVSQEYSLREILLCLLGCTANLSNEQRKESDDKLATRFYQSLKGWRYLVVVDDVWDTKALDNLKMLFPDDNNQSRIMLTTRLLDVAVYPNSFSPPHQMHFLSDAESWNLLQKKVFMEERCPSELEKAGKEIAKKCRGLPLSIVVVAGLLSKFNRTKDSWEHVIESVSSAITSNDEQCLKILFLSYNYLPHHLKPCLLHMGAFPEDYKHRVSKLAKLWVAEGFIKPIDSKSSDEIAIDYLQDLIDRNLILIHQKGSNGKTKSCGIHDILRELCLREGHREKFLCVLKGTGNTSVHDTNTDVHRRLIIHGDDQKIMDRSPDLASVLNRYLKYKRRASSINDSLKSVSVSARSFICIGRIDILSSLYLAFRLLRVLDVAEIEFKDFPEKVLELSNLRYLAFTAFGNIPSSISVLKNLETLIVHQALLSLPAELPSEIWEMPQLKHISFTSCILPPDFSRAETDGTVSVFPESSNLVTISVVRNFKCTEGNLRRLQNVKKLVLEYTFKTSSEEWSCFCLNNLHRLQKLEKLKFLCFGDPFSFIHVYPHLGSCVFPPKLSFPPNLKKLTLHYTYLPWEDLALIGMLPKLEVLKLSDRAFNGPIWEPIEGQFQQLKYLKLERMDLRSWVADETHFPTLRNLVLRYCKWLQEIPSAIGYIPTLQLLQVAPLLSLQRLL